MKKIKFIIPCFLCLVIVVCGFYFNAYTQKSSNFTSIEFIHEHFNNAGKLLDYQNEIGVKDIDDIKLFVKDKNVKIEFGFIKLDWTMEEFLTEEVQKALEKIYITCRRDKETGRLRVFYKGQELQRWVSAF